MEGRPTPNRSASSFSEGSWVPIANSPVVIAFSRASTMSWARLRLPIGGPVISGSVTGEVKGRERRGDAERNEHRADRVRHRGHAGSERAHDEDRQGFAPADGEARQDEIIDGERYRHQRRADH